MARLVHKILARHPGIWRVDGIGPIENRGRLGTRTVAYFSGLMEGGLAYPYKKSSLSRAILALPVHSATLREFRIGSIWSEGRRVAGPSQIEPGFCIDVSQIRIVALEERCNLNGFWVPTVVPDSYFFLGNNRTYLSPTLYALVPVVNDPRTQWLVVPTSELLRFYIGVSSRFLAGALQGRFEHFIDWNRSGIEQDRPVIHVMQPPNRKEAAVLSRTVVSETAKSSLLGIHQHLSATRANNAALDEPAKRPLLIRATFPFADQTSLSVAGKRMKLASKGDQEEWAVFAMEILSCSHPWGFSRTIIQSDDPFESNRREGGEGNAQGPRFHPHREGDKDEYPIDDFEADGRLRRLTVRTYTNQFDAFGSLEFEHRRPQKDKETYKPGTHIDVPVDALTLGDGTHSNEAKGNLGVSDFQSRVEEVDRELSVFLDMLDHLRIATKKRAWMINTHSFKDGLTYRNERINQFPDKIRKLRSWHLVTEPSGNVRPRQVALVKLALSAEGQRCFYLLEMELKPGESGQCTLMLFANDFAHLAKETVDDLLLLTAIHKRWPNRHIQWEREDDSERAQTLFSKHRIYRIPHPPVHRQKEGDKPDNDKPALNPKEWSATLLGEIDELLTGKI